MNEKSKYLSKIADIVVDCCSTEIDSSGAMSFTKDELLGTSRKENVVMSRCILTMIVLREGYSVSTLKDFLKKTDHAIRNLHQKGQDYLVCSRAFKIAFEDCKKKVDKLRESVELLDNNV